jgi:hypothetical protein
VGVDGGVVAGGCGAAGFEVAVGTGLAGADAEGVGVGDALGDGEAAGRLRVPPGALVVADGLGRAEPMSDEPKSERTAGMRDAGVPSLPNGIGTSPHVNPLAIASAKAKLHSAVTLRQPPSASARLAMYFLKTNSWNQGMNVLRYYKTIMLKKQQSVRIFRYNRTI